MPRKMVGVRFKRNAKFLHELSRIRSDAKRQQLITQANPNQIFAIMDAANNILNGRFPVTQKQRYRLLPHREKIRMLGRAKNDARARRVIQTGGGAFLPALLAPILAELGVYLVRKIIKRNENEEKNS